MDITNEKHPFLKLFTSSFSLSSVTFGGGYVMIPLMKRKYVNDYGWLTDNQMLDIASLAQTAPGAVAVNAAMLIGRKLLGRRGMFLAALATVLPPFITLTIVSVFYNAFKSSGVIRAFLWGVQVAVVAVIADVIISLCADLFKLKKIFPIAVLAASFIACCIFSVNIMLVISVCGVLGAILAQTRFGGKLL